MRLFSLLVFGLVSLKSFAIDLSSHILNQETTIKNYLTHLDSMPILSGLREVDALYVINLDERTEKWEDTRQKLEKCDVKFNRFSAIAGWKIPAETLARFWNEQGYHSEHPPLKYGKLGCILSHLSAIQDAYDRGFKRVWILQDDIEVLADLHLADDYLKELDQIDPNWGLLFTDLDMRSYKKENVPLRSLSIAGAYRKGQKTMPEAWYQVREDINENFQKIRSRYGFHSVIVSRLGMEIILNYFKHVVLHSSFDIDIHFIPNLNKYGLKKPLISNATDWFVSDNDPRAKYHDIKSMPYPYNQLSKLIPYNDKGYYGNEHLLEKMIVRNKPKVIVELGSSLGKSTNHLARKMEMDGKLYVVGSWAEGASIQDSLSGELKTSPYIQFLANVVHENLVDKIIPLKMSVNEAIQKLKGENVKIDFLYVDASHNESDIYRELTSFYPLLNKSAVICGNINDNRDSDPPFRKALTKFAKEKQLKVKNLCNRSFWMLVEN